MTRSPTARFMGAALSLPLALLACLALPALPSLSGFPGVPQFPSFFLGQHEAAAQGFGVYQHGACTMARGGAAVALPCPDGSAIFFNPAAIAGLEGSTLTGGATLLVTDGHFTDKATGEATALQSDPQLSPHAYFTHGSGERWGVGIGLYLPYAFATEWPQDFEGAFISYDSSLRSIYIQPTVAWQLSDRISIGAGFAGVLGTVELNRMLDLSEQPVPGQPVTWGDAGIPRGTAFARAELESDWATGAGAHVGVRARLTDRLYLGARYLTRVTLEYEGDGRFEQVETGIVLPDGNPLGLPEGTPLDPLLQAAFQAGPLVEQRVRTEATMPAMAVLGLAFRATPRMAFMLDWQWTEWSIFDQVDLVFDDESLNRTLVQNYGDTNALRAGAEFLLTPAWTLDVGYFFNEAASPDETVTPLVPEADRNHFTGGLGWQASPGMELRATYHYLSQDDRRGRTRDAPDGSPPTTDLNTGTYQFSAHLLALTLALNF